jgi:hypothetical protein
VAAGQLKHVLVAIEPEVEVRQPADRRRTERKRGRGQATFATVWIVNPVQIMEISVDVIVDVGGGAGARCRARKAVDGSDRVEGRRPPMRRRRVWATAPGLPGAIR